MRRLLIMILSISLLLIIFGTKASALTIYTLDATSLTSYNNKIKILHIHPDGAHKIVGVDNPISITDDPNDMVMFLIKADFYNNNMYDKFEVYDYYIVLSPYMTVNDLKQIGTVNDTTIYIDENSVYEMIKAGYVNYKEYEITTPNPKSIVLIVNEEKNRVIYDTISKYSSEGYDDLKVYDLNSNTVTQLSEYNIYDYGAHKTKLFVLDLDSKIIAVDTKTYKAFDSNYNVYTTTTLNEAIQDALPFVVFDSNTYDIYSLINLYLYKMNAIYDTVDTITYWGSIYSLYSQTNYFNENSTVLSSLRMYYYNDNNRWHFVSLTLLDEYYFIGWRFSYGHVYSNYVIDKVFAIQNNRQSMFAVTNDLQHYKILITDYITVLRYNKNENYFDKLIQITKNGIHSWIITDSNYYYIQPNQKANELSNLITVYLDDFDGIVVSENVKKKITAGNGITLSKNDYVQIYLYNSFNTPTPTTYILLYAGNVTDLLKIAHTSTDSEIHITLYDIIFKSFLSNSKSVFIDFVASDHFDNNIVYYITRYGSDYIMYQPSDGPTIVNNDFNDYTGWNNPVITDFLVFIPKYDKLYNFISKSSISTANTVLDIDPTSKFFLMYSKDHFTYFSNNQFYSKSFVINLETNDLSEDATLQAKFAGFSSIRLFLHSNDINSAYYLPFLITIGRNNDIKVSLISLTGISYFYNALLNAYFDNVYFLIDTSFDDNNVLTNGKIVKVFYNPENGVYDFDIISDIQSDNNYKSIYFNLTMNDSAIFIGSEDNSVSVSDLTNNENVDNTTNTTTENDNGGGTGGVIDNETISVDKYTIYIEDPLHYFSNSLYSIAFFREHHMITAIRIYKDNYDNYYIQISKELYRQLKENSTLVKIYDYNYNKYSVTADKFFNFIESYNQSYGVLKYRIGLNYVNQTIIRIDIYYQVSDQTPENINLLKNSKYYLYDKKTNRFINPAQITNAETTSNTIVYTYYVTEFDKYRFKIYIRNSYGQKSIEMYNCSISEPSASYKVVYVNVDEIMKDTIEMYKTYENVKSNVKTIFTTPNYLFTVILLVIAVVIYIKTKEINITFFSIFILSSIFGALGLINVKLVVTYIIITLLLVAFRVLSNLNTSSNQNNEKE